MLHSAWCCFGSFFLGCMNDRIWRTNIMSGICQISVTVPADLCCFLASMWFSTHLNSQLYHWCPCCPAAVCTVLSVGTPLCACVWRNMFRQDVTVSVISFNSIWVKYISPQCRVSVEAQLIILEYGSLFYVADRCCQALYHLSHWIGISAFQWWTEEMWSHLLINSMYLRLLDII